MAMTASEHIAAAQKVLSDMNGVTAEAGQIIAGAAVVSAHALIAIALKTSKS